MEQNPFQAPLARPRLSRRKAARFIPTGTGLIIILASSTILMLAYGLALSYKAAAR